jgi:hypothetical protein
MRRIGFLSRTVLLVSAALGLGVLIAPAGGLRAQDAPSLDATHPVVGTWYLSLPGNDPGPAPSFTTYFADGNVLVTALAGPRITIWHGSWAPTGPRSATFTIASATIAEDGSFAESLTITGTTEVDASGTAFTSTGTLTIGDIASGGKSTADVPGIGFRITADAAPALGSPTP